jgi:two-component system, sensor histidine kinase PdtaS
MSVRHIQLDEYLGQAFDRIPVAMVVVNQQGLITRVNRLAVSTFGYPSEELLGQPVEMLVPERYRRAHPGYRQGFQTEASARPMGAGRDLSGLRKDGSEFPVEIGINPVDTGEGPMILSVILDLSERKQNEKRIHDALREKELLLEEVHHRVKNNLQVIHSLLDLQMMKVTDPVLLGVLRNSQNRIRSMVMIHRTLYQSHDFAQVDFHRFLSELLPTLDVKLPINQAIPCGLIVNELVSNALKHGFSHQERGTIRVAMAPDDHNHIGLSISNDGAPIGPDQDLDRTGSLGLQLVRMLTRQLHGQLDVQRDPTTRFSLRFPLTPHP